MITSGQHCIDEAQCEGWTWTSPEHVGPGPAKSCYLKHNLTHPRPSQNKKSGIRGCGGIRGSKNFLVFKHFPLNFIRVKIEGQILLHLIRQVYIKFILNKYNHQRHYRQQQPQQQQRLQVINQQLHKITDQPQL